MVDGSSMEEDMMDESNHHKNAAKSDFMKVLVKNLRAICNDYFPFDQNIEVIGHIYLKVDCSAKFNYFLNEVLAKTGSKETLVTSNSFHAEPDSHDVQQGVLISCNAEQNKPLTRAKTTFQKRSTKPIESSTIYSTPNTSQVISNDTILNQNSQYKNTLGIVETQPTKTEKSHSSEMNHPANEADNEEMYSSLHTWFAPPETSITKAGIRRRAKNNYYSPEIRAKIGRYAVEHGNSLTAEKFSRELNMDVGESTVRSIKKRYLMSVQEMDTEIEALKSAPRGRPLMLGDIDKKIVQLVSEILQTGGTVNGTIVTAIAKGAVRRENKSLLRENGGHIDITRAWAQSFLTRMGLVKPKSERTAGKVARDIGNDKSTFLDDIKKCVSEYGIPKELIINFSQVHLNIVPVSNWTTSIESLSSQTNKDLENCEVTAVLASTASGKLIPPLVLYGGETDICCPEYQFPNNWHVSHINHQWDEQSMIDYAKNVLRQYIDNIKKELGLSRTQQALIISDVYNLDQVNSIINILNEWSMIPFFVPAGYAEDLQPMDLGFNSEFRNLVQNEFCEWYAHCIEKEPDSCVNLNFKLLAPLHAGWMVKTFNTMHNNKDVILSGWKKTGILEVYDSVTSTDCGAKEAVDTNEHSVLDADINVKQEKFVT